MVILASFLDDLKTEIVGSDVYVFPVDPTPIWSDPVSQISTIFERGKSVLESAKNHHKRLGNNV